jgi:hypothetical protein
MSEKPPMNEKKIYIGKMTKGFILCKLYEANYPTHLNQRTKS